MNGTGTGRAERRERPDEVASAAPGRAEEAVTPTAMAAPEAVTEAAIRAEEFSIRPVCSRESEAAW
ncbi:hypothetical protein [Nonomuraea dietziae]|uniref:hypothetical protein n=1 Tax=Nonomuraea dietziae TaxID=65515 RepID=UPI0034294F14